MTTIPGYDLGMIGLGVMGRNLVLNIADHGYAVVGYDKDLSKVAALRSEAGSRNIHGAESLEEFAGSLRRPAAVMLLVPAGAVVDIVIQGLLPLLEAGDLIIDGGNSHFKDTDRRAKMLAEKGLHFLGVGISGGESGARHGPSLMPGGPTEAYQRVQPIFEAVAAKVDGNPCVTYLGPGAVGHFVKMVHNGIEYGLMQLISEAYDLMKRGLGLSTATLHDVFAQWNQTELNAYLLEITAHIFQQTDDKTGRPLVEVILDEAAQKGTGMWTSQDAMDLQVPIPTIDAAVAMRDLSSHKNERLAASLMLTGFSVTFNGDREHFMAQLRRALYAATIITFSQGLALLRAASQAYNYGLNLENVARIWRGGCIIRAAVLEDIRSAFMAQPDLPNLMLEARIAQKVLMRQNDLRAVAQTAIILGIPAPALTASLAYFDGLRSAWLPANLIQAQRDYFGAHTYQRLDMEGVFHTQWRHEN